MPVFRAKLLDVEQGQHEVVLHEEDARLLDAGVMDRVKLVSGKRCAVAIADHSRSMVKRGEIGLFKEVSDCLNARAGVRVFVDLASRPQSLEFIRNKLDGKVLADVEVKAIIADLMEEKLSSAELAAFIAGVYTRGLSTDETVSLTEAILESGGRFVWSGKKVLSEHSIGGVSGDRSSMLVVPIIASLGLLIPKTCTKAISSASATADAMEVLARVDLTLGEARKVVEKTSGCLIWGGGVDIAAADDKLIKIRNPLHLDPKPLLLSSILAKKKAEGAEFVLLDIPVGPGAKIQHSDEAKELANSFEALGKHLGMQVKCVLSDGARPLLSQFGACLEARAVLEALAGEKHLELREKACLMSGLLLSMVRGVTREEGYKIARQALVSGKALRKMREIIGAQGGDAGVVPEDIKLGKFVKTIRSREEGRVAYVDNRAVIRVCRSLGAPFDKKAGMVLHKREGDLLKKGEDLLTIYSSSSEKIGFALEQLKQINPVKTQKIILSVV